MNPCIPHHKVVMIPHASIISNGEVSIMVLFLPYSLHYTAVRSNKWSKSMSVIKVATMKNAIMPRTPFIV